MNTNRRGNVLYTVIGLAAVVVVGLAVWYFVSDPFRTKVDSAMTEATKWTPKQIAKDPENYLNFCEKRANKALEDLKAAKISIAQSEGTVNLSKKNASEKIDLAKDQLKSLKTAYEKAGETNTWPISFGNQSLTKETADLQIVTLFKGYQSQQGRVTSADTQLKLLEKQKLKIMEAEADTQTQLDKIRTGREQIKTQKITDDLANQLASVQGVLGTTIDAAANTGSTIKTLDQLANESAPKASGADVKNILDQIK